MNRTVDIQNYPFSQRLVADGAWGTELMKRGLSGGTAGERLNIEAPEVVRELATDYLRAGADIILTNTFTGSKPQLARHSLEDRASEINRTGVELSRSAVERLDIESGAGRHGCIPRAVVAASIGPTGKLLLTGDITESEMRAAFRTQAEAALLGNPDWILVESMTDLEEMSAALTSVREVTTLPVVSSMVFEKMKQGYRTIMGNTPETCVARCLDEGATIIGANCGTGIENYLDLAELLCSMNVAPVWIKPNAGMPTLESGTTKYLQTPADFASFVPSLLETGVSIVGGCCGTTPAFTSAIRAVVTKFNQRLSR